MTDHLPLRVMEIKTKVNKLDLIMLKSFCTTKETVSKVKRQLSEWEKIIANETTDKGLVSKIYKQLIQLNARKTNNPIKKWGKRPKQTFLQRRHTDGQQKHEKILNIAHYSVQFSRSVVSDSLRPHESQHARPPCPSPTPGVHPDSCPSSQ